MFSHLEGAGCLLWMPRARLTTEERSVVTGVSSLFGMMGESESLVVCCARYMPCIMHVLFIGASGALRNIILDR